jgi:molybdopterin molybdotransferase
MKPLLAIEEAQHRLLALAHPVEAESVDMAAAPGRWLAEDIAALRTQPAADLSAMDGYAVRYSERPGPWTVVGESAAGTAFNTPLAPGEAARIFTGAPVPSGADTVIMQEDMTRDGERVTLSEEGPPGPGSHIRTQGRDFAKGEVLLGAGERLTPARLGLAITAGHGTLPVARQIRIALISTGSELREPGEITGIAELPASNGPMLTAMLSSWPVVIDDLGIVPDDFATLARAIDAARRADIIVTIGGASVGDHDLVRPVLIEAGAELDFWRIAMKPGKPVMAGTLGSTVTVGLPGNPASAFVGAMLFLFPLIAHLSGSKNALPVYRTAPLGTSLPAVGKRSEFLRAAWDGNRVVAIDQQSSAALAALAAAELLIHRPARSTAAQKDTLVPILPIA